MKHAQELSMAEFKAIEQIAKRVVERFEDINLMTVMLDLAACHQNGCPLELDRMVDGQDHDIFHDVFGIRRNIDRKTGQLMNCFWPRFAQ